MITLRDGSNGPPHYPKPPPPRNPPSGSDGRVRRFEYKLVEGDLLIYKKELDALGRKGWELCSVAWGYAIFKRVIV